MRLVATPERAIGRSPRAVLPSPGCEPWHPSAELLEALDEYDASVLRRELAFAREDLARALMLALVALSLFVGGAFVLSGGAVLQGIGGFGMLVLGVLTGLLAAHVYHDALTLQARAYRIASHELDKKLRRDPMPSAIRALTDEDLR